MLTRRRIAAIALSALVVLAGAYGLHRREARIRADLFAALTPVTLANCDLARVGDANDGGYVLCRNLLEPVRAAYSYGINGTDNWGCEISRTLRVPVHQYDCFNATVPACPGGDTRFHAACIAEAPRTVDGRDFDTLAAHLAANVDDRKMLLVKMDVEGSEWASLREAADADLGRITQLSVEFHGVEQASFVDTIRRLTERFHVVSVHMNNVLCEPGYDPFPSPAYEVLFVHKSIGAVAPAPRPERHTPLDAPNAPAMPDCQTIARETASSELAMFRRWVRRAVRGLFAESAFAS